MGDPRYDILFGGELLPGSDPATVADNLARLFTATPETVARLMDGGVHALKRGTDRETALKYQAAMQKAGAKAILREATDPAQATATATPPPAAPPSPAPATPAPVQIGLAPAGGLLLAEHERRAPPPVQVDTSHIKLVSTFMAPEEPGRPAPPPAPDTSHITVAAPGADLLPERDASAPPPPPDTSAITLAPPGETLAPAVERPGVPLPDLSGISLAPPGAPLEELRPTRAPLNPDTSRLALEPPA